MTNTPQHWLSHLAAADSFTHMGQRFQRHHSDWQLSQLLLLILLIVTSGIGVYLVSQYIHRRSGGGNYARALFAELCRAHRLDWSARRLLAQLASSQRLSSPAQLFLEPQYFEADRLDDAMQKRREELHLLRDKMFGAEWCESNLGSCRHEHRETGSESAR